MVDVSEVVEVWSRAGHGRSLGRRLSLYARALTAEGPLGRYRVLTDDQQDRAILALYRVDRPHATIADLHQIPPLALSGYCLLLHDLAHEGLGPIHESRSLRDGRPL